MKQTEEQFQEDFNHYDRSNYITDRADLVKRCFCQRGDRGHINERNKTKTSYCPGKYPGEKS